MLEELEMADRISELSCTRATEFVEEQLRYVSELRVRVSDKLISVGIHDRAILF